jgi:hypothetical protein
MSEVDTIVSVGHDTIKMGWPDVYTATVSGCIRRLTIERLSPKNAA